MKQKPTGDFKKFINIGKNKTRVIGSVERFLLAKPRNTDRRTDVLHPSAMVKSDWCYRASYFELIGREPAPSKYKASLRQLLTFDEGHRIHDRWQRWFGEMGSLYGIWECSSCLAKVWGLGWDECQDCGAVYDTYKEVKLVHEDLRIHGHADGWLIGFGEPLLLEIKSVGAGTVRFENPDLFYKHDGIMENIWKELDAPFYSHIMQAQLYMKLIELIGMPNPPKEALFLYESKATQEVKEFVIPKSDFGIDVILEGARLVVSAVDKGVPPTCNIDPVAGCHSCNYHTEEINEHAEAGASSR